MTALAGTAALASLVAQAQDDSQLFLGKDFLPWMVLAFGAALVIGPLVTLVKPPADAGEARASRPGRRWVAPWR